MQYQYRSHSQPGCGGCLFLIALLLLLMGGTPLLFEVMGVIFFTGLIVLFLGVASFWGFSYYIRKKVSEYESSQTDTHNNFVNLLVHILVRIAQADGVVAKEEINTIHNFFRYNLHYSTNQLHWVKELIKEAIASPLELDSLLASFKSSFAYEPRLILLELVYQVIFSKSPVLDKELELARRIGEYLEISAYDRESIRTRYASRAATRAVQEEDYYGVLGLSKGAGFEQIKKAYRTLSMQYHPDKVAHLGEEFRRVAEEKMKEINVAYQHLKQIHGET